MAEFTKEQIDAALVGNVDAEKQGIRQQLLVASDTNPDTYAQNSIIARQLRTTPDIVDLDPDMAKKEVMYSPDLVHRILYGGEAITNTILNNAKLIHDDIPLTVSALNKVRAFGAGALSVASDVPSAAGNLATMGAEMVRQIPTANTSEGGTAMIGDDPLLSVGLDAVDTTGTGWSAIGKFFEKNLVENIDVPAEQRTFMDEVAGGLGSIAAFMLDPTKGAVSMSSSGFQTQMKKIQDEEAAGRYVPLEEKVTRGFIGGGISLLLEKVSLGTIKGEFAPILGSVTKSLPKQMQGKWAQGLMQIGEAATVEGTQEVLETMLHDLTSAAAGDKNVEFFKNWEQEALVGGAAGGIFRGLIMSAMGIRARGQVKDYEQRTQEHRDNLSDIKDALQATKLSTRDPEKLRELLKEHNPDGKTVILDGSVIEHFNQSGLDPEDFYAYAPSARAEFEDAIESGRDIEIPYDEFLAAFATHPDNAYDSMLDFVKVDPSGSPDLQGWDMQDQDQKNAFVEWAMEQVRLEPDGAETKPEIYQNIERQIRDNLMNPEVMGEKVRSADMADVEATYIAAMAKGIMRREGGEASKRVFEQAFGANFQIQGYKPPIARKFGTGNAYFDKLRDKQRAMDRAAKKAEKAAEGKKGLFGREKTKKREKVTPTPIISYIAKQGGIDPESSFGQDMADYINPKTHSRFFKKGSKFRPDSIPVSELEDALGVSGVFGLDADNNGYVNLQELKDAIRDETFGQYTKTDAQREQEQLDEQDSQMLDFLDQQGIDILTASADEINAAVEKARQEYQARFEGDGGEESYFQDNNAQILFGKNGQRIIKLFEKANPSSLLHEMGHDFLSIMDQIAAQPDVNPEFLTEYEAVLKYLGAKKGEKFTRKQHEKFARTYEAYTYRGKAPSRELIPIMQRFSSFLKTVYQSIKQLRVPMNDDIIAFFDRMLATDEEIEAMKNDPVLTVDQATLEMLSPAQREQYTKAQERDYEEAKDKLFRKAYRQHLRKAKTFWKEEAAKVQADVEKQLQDMPVYKAIHFLKTGQSFDGKQTPIEDFKLDVDAVKKVFDYGRANDPLGKYELKYLPRGVRSGKNGIDPQVVADFFGFNSALEMLRAMQNAEPYPARVQKMTEDIMIARHGDMLNDGTITKEALAMAMAQSTQREQIVLQALSERTGIEYPSDGDFKRAAKIALGKLKVDIAVKPEKYYSAALRAEREYGRALGKKQYGDEVKTGKDGKVTIVKGAASWKRQAILNKHLFKMARDARADTQKTLKYFDKMKKRPPLRNAKAVKIDPEYHQKIWDLLDKYNLDPRLSDEKRERITLAAVNQFMKEKEVNENAVMVMPPALVNADTKTHYRDLTMEEFRSLRDLIKNLEAQGRAKRTYILNGEKKELDAHARVLRDIAEENAPKRNPKAEGIIQNVMTTLDIVTGKMAQTMTYLDGGDNMGQWMQSIYIPIHTAETNRWQRARQEYDNFNKIMKAAFQDAGSGYLNEEVGNYHREPFKMTRERMIMLAMYYTGTPATRQKLIAGYKEEFGWDEAYIKDVLSHMSERDWDFVMATRDYLESFWAETSAIEARRFGYAPEKQDVLPDEKFITREGKEITVRGGYMRIIYDPDLGVAAANNKTRETIEDMKVFKSARSMTKNGSMIEQVDNVKRPMLLSFDGIVQHLTETTTHITMAETVDQTLKILHHADTQKALFDALGGDGKNMVDLWLQDVVAGGALSGNKISRGLRAVRNNYTVGRLALRPLQAILQVSGLVQAMGDPEIKSYIPFALAAPLSQKEEIYELSMFMRERKFTLNRDIADSVNYYKQKGKYLSEKVATLMLYPLQKVQEQVDIITWTAGYRYALDKGMRQEEAVTYANLAVERLQGGGSVSNLSGVERGTLGTGTQREEYVKAAFGFYSYFNAKYNIAKNANIKFRNKEITSFDLAMTYMMVYLVEGLISATIMGQLDFDRDDDEQITPQEIGAAGLQVALGQFSASVPFVRDIYSGAEGFEGATGTFGQITGLGKFAADVILETGDAIEGEEVNKYKLLREGMNALNVFVPLPAGMINQFLRGIQKEEETGDAELLDYLVYRKK